MTCVLNTYGKISNLANIVKYLSQRDEIAASTGDDQTSAQPKEAWLNDWTWDEDKNRTAKNEQQQQQQAKMNIFDQFLFSFSPTGNLLVIASKYNMIVCQSKWDLNNQVKYSISSRKDLNENENEFITSIICVPLASQRVSGEGMLDWTCIVVGFNTGNIRMYTENGTLLITQMFHDTRVLKIKCRTFEHQKYIGWISQPDEIEILYEPNVLVCLDGANLYHYLRAARKYAASLSSEQNEMMETISSLSLDYKKWILDSQEVLSDFVSAGVTSENRFDQLFAASMIGGPNEKFESIPPMANRYLACGQSPYISFYYAIEGLGQPVLLEVKAVAGKITSSLMNAAKGWMGFNKASNTQVKSKPKIEPPTSLPSRFGLQDYRRNGENIIISPGNNLAATTDSFARVILFDVVKGIAIRIFKGYRDAQIGWMCVDDESEEKLNKRYALYLIIYAPRRGLLEVWGCQQGIRVAAFNVGKNARLIYPGYFMLSLNGSLLNNHLKQSNQHMQCVLINSDGLIKTLHIPFHLILSDKSNQRVRDTILLKKLKSYLKENDRDHDQLWNSINLLVSDFKTPVIKQQALERIINTSYLDAHKILLLFQKQLELIDKQKNNLSAEMFKLGQFLRLTLKIIRSYLLVNIQNGRKPEKINTEEVVKPETSEESEPKPDENTTIKSVDDEKPGDSFLTKLSNLFNIEEDDLKSYFELKKILEEKKDAKKRGKKVVKFEAQTTGAEEEEAKNDVDRFTLTNYRACFELSVMSSLTASGADPLVDNSRRRFFDMKKSTTNADKQQLGSFLFGSLLITDAAYEKKFIKKFLRLVPLKKMQLLDLLIHAWLSGTYSNIYNYYKLVFYLSGCASHMMNADYDYETLTASENEELDELTNAAANVDAAADDSSSMSLVDEQDEDDLENHFINEYLIKFKNIAEMSKSLIESLLTTWILRSILIQAQMDSNNVEMLNVLSHRLYCLINLKILLLCGKRSILDLLDENEDDGSEDTFYNIKKILAKGKGILSELVARHAVLNEFAPKLLSILEEDTEFDEITKDGIRDHNQELMAILNDPVHKQFYDTLQETRKYLPKSLECDTLLVNCAWESINAYNKDQEKNVKYLENSLRFCGEIGNAIIKQGILSLIWHTHLSKRILLLTELLDKTGRLTKERSLRKEIGINEETILEFLKCVMTLLDLIIDANCNLNEVPIFNYDLFWKDYGDYNSQISTNVILNFSNNDTSLMGSKSKASSSSLKSGSSSSTSSMATAPANTSSKQLVELAAEQKYVNYHLCSFHYQLIRILYLIIKFNMKSAKPYSFFDTKGKQALASELHTHPLISNDVDIKIANARKLFFTKAINSIMQNLEHPTGVKSKIADDINDNLKIVFNLSEDMGVDKEYIKRYYCCMLFAMDYQHEAEKIFHAIKETELLASQLLVVAGIKVNEALSNNFDAGLIALMSTNLNSWLKSLGSSDYRIYNLPSKQTLIELIGIILNKMPEKFAEYKIAVELYDFIENPLFQIRK